MMSLETIVSENRKAHERAAVKNTRPFIVDQSDIDAWKNDNAAPLPFPFIGDYVADGFEPDGDALFCDSSGLGADWEPALTRTQLLNELQPGKAYAITECGQFQVYVQPFRVVAYRYAKQNQ